MYYRIFSKTIMKKCFIFYIHANPSSKMLTAWLIAVILLLVVQCMVVLNVVLSNSFLSDVIVVSVLSVEPSTPYAGNHKNDSKLNLAIAKEKRKIFLSFNRWRDCILHSFGYDPLKCPCCGETMTFLDLYYNHQHISLNEMYERTMHRFHAHSSA